MRGLFWAPKYMFKVIKKQNIYTLKKFAYGYLNLQSHFYPNIFCLTGPMGVGLF